MIEPEPVGGTYPGGTYKVVAVVPKVGVVATGLVGAAVIDVA
jgi:hypothetical protein